MNSKVFKLAIPSVALTLCVLSSVSVSQQANEQQTSGSKTSEVNALCVDCHEEVVTSLSDSPHRHDSLSSRELLCTTCHSENAEAHAEEPYDAAISNPASLSSAGQRTLCSNCHQPHLQLDNAEFDPHTAENIACASCHQIHAAPPSLLVDDKTTFCGKCHISVSADFRKRSAHPVLSGGMDCLACHDFTGKNQPQFGHGANANCRTCHAQQSGPFLFEHPATSSFSAEGGNCTACHQPHGSNNDRLLVQTSSSLCQSCHGTPPGHRSAHEGIGVSVDCMDCHSDMHGSSDNRFLLDTRLGTKLSGAPASCYCHGVNE